MPWTNDSRFTRRLAAEEETLRPALAGWTGRLALQVGSPDLTLGAAAHYVQWVKVDSVFARDCVQVCPHALPFAQASVEAVFLVHALETAAAPAAVIAEAARVLQGEGRLVVIGFRPFSPAALRRISPSSRQVHLRWVGPWRLRWLMTRAGLLWDGLIPLPCSPWGRRLPPPLQRLAAGSYAAVAVKRVAGMTVLRPVWKRSSRERRAIMPGAGRAG